MFQLTLHSAGIAAREKEFPRQCLQARQARSLPRAGSSCPKLRDDKHRRPEGSPLRKKTAPARKASRRRVRAAQNEWIVLLECAARSIVTRRYTCPGRSRLTAQRPLHGSAFEAKAGRQQ